MHTATEISSDNSALSRNIRKSNIRKNENALQGASCDVSVIFDDSIVQDSASENRQDTAEAATGLMTCEE